MATTKIIPGVLDLNSATSDKGLKMPSGTEFNRPTDATGQIRNNTNEISNGSASCQEYYNGTAWKKITNIFPPSFNTVTYTGTGATQSITGVGFQPDLVWIKSRSGAIGNFSHVLMDSTRGASNYISSNLNNAEATAATGLVSFDTDGFTVGSAAGSWNYNGTNYVAWCWKVNGGTTSSNTDGSITSTVQVNNTAGFSMVKWTGNGGTNETVGHGLSSVPEFIIVKDTSAATPWYSYNAYLNGGVNPADYFVALSSTQAQTLNTGSPPSLFAGTEPTNSVFSVGSTYAANTNVFIAYCFSSVAGYSKSGTYTGNGATNAITGLGFQPNWIIARRIDVTDNWAIINSVTNTYLLANLSDAEATYTWFAFTSDGFTLSTATLNASGGTYIYMAFK